MLYAADRDSSGWRITNSDGQTMLLNDKAFFSLDWLNEGDTLIVEGVHLQPSKGRSLAQRFSYDQLWQLYSLSESRGITILAWPDRQTAAYRARHGLEKKNADEARHILAAYEEQSQLDVRKWKPHTEESGRLHAGFAGIRKEMSFRLNVMRCVNEAGKSYSDPESIRGLEFLAKLVPHLEPATVDMFRMRTTGKGVGGFTGDLRKGAALALWVAATNEDGSLRPVSLHIIWDKLLRTCPDRHGGTARSNLTHHFLRHLLNEGKSGYNRQEWRHACKDLLRNIRLALSDSA